MAKVETKQLFDEFATQKAANTSIAKRLILNAIDRPEVYEWEKKLNKQLIDMNEDELFDMILSFRKRTSGGVEVRLSPNYMRNVIMWYRDLWNYYSKEYEAVINPFNYDKLTMVNITKNLVKDTSPITKETIDKIIKGIRMQNDNTTADYLECLVLLFYCGVRDGKEIVSLKEDMIDFRKREIYFDDRTVKLSARCMILLQRVHEMDSINSENGYFVFIAEAYNGGYFKFFVHEIRKDAKNNWTPEHLSSNITKKIANSSKDALGHPVTARQIYYAGFYNYLCEKFGKDLTNNIIRSNRDGEKNRLLLDTAAEYGVTDKNPVSLKRSLLFYA